MMLELTFITAFIRSPITTHCFPCTRDAIADCWDVAVTHRSPFSTEKHRFVVAVGSIRGRRTTCQHAFVVFLLRPFRDDFGFGNTRGRRRQVWTSSVAVESIYCWIVLFASACPWTMPFVIWHPCAISQ
jgi:hypothetical protein